MTIAKNVCDIALADRAAIEHVLGAALSDDQQVLISVLPVPMNSDEQRAFDSEMEQWDAASDEDFKSFMNDLER